ncbi:MAG: SHOCT domain-containing protein [Nitrospira sp.]|nr:SHOCT domain-containing protein [Nitrospira sp.]
MPRTTLASNGQGRPFQHPFDLTQAEWETTVGSVMVRSVHSPLLGPSYQGTTEPVFSEEEVRYLGVSLRHAFQQATAQQQVAFALARVSDAGMEQLTSGAWFVEAGRIYLRLANCRVTVTMPSIRKQIWINPLFAQAGAFYDLVPGERQALVTPARDSGNPFRPAPAELEINYRGMTGQVQEPASSGNTSPSAPARPLEEQLGLLKRLHEQGLITEEEYRAKKQQLLDRL